MEYYADLSYLSTTMTPLKRVDPFNVKLNEGTAYLMARFSKAAYIRLDDGSPDTAKILADLRAEDAGIVDVTAFSNQGSSAILVEHADYFALAF